MYADDMFRVPGSLSARTAPVAAAAGALLSKRSYTMATVPIQARVRASLKVNDNRKKAPAWLYIPNLDLRGEQISRSDHLITLIYSHLNPAFHGYVRSGIHGDEKPVDI